MGYPYQPQQQYPPQNPGYPPQPPQYPQPYAPQQQPQPAYAPPQYPPPQQQLARGTIDDFYDQPAASGKSISFNGKPPGTTYAGVVARTMTNADIQQQTDISRRPLYHPDGRPKYVMVIPLQLQPSAEFPDGRAAWYVKGADKTELERAMEAAGLSPGTAPEAGAMITITYTGDRPIPNLNAQKVKTITYTRPAAGPAANPAEIALGLQPVAAVQQPASYPGNGNGTPPWTTEPVAQPPGNGGYAGPAGQQPTQPQTPVQQVPQGPSQPGMQQQQGQLPGPPPMQAPPGLSPEQQQYLAQLTGQPAQ
jgi:hypothetical protein